MMFAVETYCPATDGASAARIGEEATVTRGSTPPETSRLRAALLQSSLMTSSQPAM